MTMRGGVSFVLPMYNEAGNIDQTIKTLASLAGEIAGDYEIVVADDASCDGSADIVEGLAKSDGRIKLVRLKSNSKFGGALAAGLKAASKEVVIYTDADLPVEEEDIKKALELLDTSDIVTAYSLALKDSSLKRIIISKVYNFLIQLLFGLHIRDINSGFKIYKKNVLEGLDLVSKSPFVDVEIFSEAVRRNFRIAQFGLIFRLRTKGASTISRFSVIARTFYDMLAYRFFR
jgi:glycosyltransferase involved in cell wall biosynthesis